MISKLFDEAEKATDIHIIYDGACPICNSYVKHVRLRRNFAQVCLMDARLNKDLGVHYRSKGMNLNDGMVVKINASEFYAADAINVIALLSSSSDAFNRVNAMLFKYRLVSKTLYPAMKMGRRLLLISIGRQKIDDKPTA